MVGPPAFFGAAGAVLSSGPTAGVASIGAAVYDEADAGAGWGEASPVAGVSAIIEAAGAVWIARLSNVV